MISTMGVPCRRKNATLGKHTAHIRGCGCGRSVMKGDDVRSNLVYVKGPQKQEDKKKATIQKIAYSCTLTLKPVSMYLKN